MQAHYTQFGRVELDPFRVPHTGKSTRDDGAFARQLDTQGERASQASRVTTSRRLDAGPAVNAEADTPPTAAGSPSAPVASVAGDGARSPRPSAPAAEPRLQEDEGQGQSQLGAVPPRTRASAPATSPAPVPAPATPPVPTPAAPVEVPTQPPVSVVAMTALQGVAAGSVAAATNTSGLASLAHGAGASPRTASPTATTGYRNVAKLALDRIDAARTSMLRQIAFKLQDGVSEARMQLEPPELGALDLMLTVDAAGQTKLSVIAERPEVATLLQTSMPALASTLAGQGLTITQAEVKSRDGKPRGDALHDLAARAPRATAPHHDEATPQTARMGFATTAGLDFWA